MVFANRKGVAVGEVNLYDLQAKGFAFYSMSDLSGIDKVGGHNASMSNTIEIVPSVNGNGAKFSRDVNDVIIIPNSKGWTFNGAFSIKFHFRLTSFVNQWIIGKRDDSNQWEYHIYFFQNLFQVALYSAVDADKITINTQTNPFILGQDNCIIFEYDGSLSPNGMNLNINNSNIAVTRASTGNFTGLVHGNRDVIIGRAPWNETLFPIEGVLDELYIFNDVLTPGEKTYLQNNYFPFFTDNQTPMVPTGISKKTEGFGSIELEWLDTYDDTGVVKYNIYKDGIFVVSTPNGDAYGWVNGLQKGVNYSFTITAVDFAGKESGQSEAFITSNNYNSNSLVSYYKMENDVTDSKGTNHGTPTAITYSAGLVGQTAIFNGTTSKILANSSSFDIFGTMPISMVAVVNLTALPASGKTFGITSIQENTTPGTVDKAIRITSSGQAIFYVFDGAQKHATSPAGEIAINTNYVLIGTYDGVNLKIYINGVLKATLAASGTFNFTNPTLAISHISGTTVSTNGKIDEVGVFDTALNTSAVSDITSLLLSGQSLI